MLYGRSIKFYKPLKPHYYGSKEEGKESSKEDCSKEEEEGVSHNSSTKKKSRSAVLFLCRLSNFVHDLCFLREVEST